MSEAGAAPLRTRISGWDLVWPLLAVAASIIVLVFLGVFGVMGYFHGHRLAGHRFLASLETSFWATQLLTVLVYVVFLAMLVIVLRRLDRSALVGRFAKVSPGVLAMAAASGLLFGAVFVSAAGLLSAHHLVSFHANRSERLTIPTQWQQWPLAVLALALLAPLTEEIYFRGLLLSWLNGRFGRIAAVAGSALAFGLIHFRFATHAGAEGWFLTAILTLFGALNGLWVLRTHSLRPGIVAHSVYNGALITLPLLVHH